MYENEQQQGEELQSALQKLNDEIADAIRKRDEMLSAWEDSDYNWLAQNGFIRAR